MPESRFPPIVLLALLIACLSIYGIILRPGTTFAGMDFLNLGYPRVALARSALAQGYLPLWNWYEWGGVPLLASLLGSLVYPPTWLAMLLPLPYGLQMFVFGHLLFAGVGAYAAGRHVMRLPVPAAAVCGIFYMGNAFFPGRIEQFQVIAVNSWLPWLLLATTSSLHGRNGKLWLPVAWSATLLAGHPQFAVFNFLGAAAFAGVVYMVRVIRSRNSGDSPSLVPVWRLILTCAALLLGTGIAAVQLFPTWELGTLSERIWPYSEPAHPQLEWSHLPALLVPQYYNLVSGQSGRVFGFSELGLYAGLLAVPLAAVGTIVGLRSRNSTSRLLTLTAMGIWLVAMLFALGTNGGIAPLVFENIPFFTQSRGAARSLNISALMLALLAGYGTVALLKLSVFENRKTASATALGLLLIVDAAFAHFTALKSVLVPVQSLSIRPILPESLIQSLSHSHRLYRFMAFDSDLYLNNSPAAVAERVLRLQPNMNSLSGIALVDGYEEGLMPLRSRANLLRRYNRNLRNDSPDAALLAFLGSNTMLTEFPLPSGNAWIPVAPAIPRPPIVPQIDSRLPTTYNFLRSAYVPAPALDLTALTGPGESPDAFLERCSSAFPLNELTRAPTSAQWTSHPLEAITPTEHAAAAAIFNTTPVFQQWNRLIVSNQALTSKSLILLPPYPGWKPVAEKGKELVLKPLCSLFYVLESPTKDGMPIPANLSFSPFSVRLGLFMTLISGLILTNYFCRRIGHKSCHKN